MGKRDHWHLNHRCWFCWTKFNKDKCKGCEKRELNRQEYHSREMEKLHNQCLLEKQERNRQWNKDYFEWKYGNKETTI